MKKFNENATGSTLVVLVFTSLLLSTMMISWFMLQIYGVSVAGIGLPDGNFQYSSNQDFTTNNINLSTMVTKGQDEWKYQVGIGRVLSILTDGHYFSKTYNYLLINNIQLNNAGKITNTYYINNSVKQDYTIVLRYTDGDDRVELKVKNDGLYHPRYVGLIIPPNVWEDKLLSYPQMNQIEDVTITTIYDEEGESCDFTFNGNTYTFNDASFGRGREWSGLITAKYYGGIASETEHFTIKKFTSNNVISDSADIVDQFIAFSVVMLKLVFYNISSDLLPWELNVMLIKSQGVALLVGLYVLIRSGT